MANVDLTGHRGDWSSTRRSDPPTQLCTLLADVKQMSDRLRRSFTNKKVQARA